MVRPLALAVPILTLALSSNAFAQPSLVQPLAQPAQSEQPDVVVTSYRDQILITSGIGIGAFLGGAVAEGPNGRDTEASNALFTVGMIGTFVAPSVVHFAHGEVGRGIGSFGMRWGLASVAGLVAMKVVDCNPDVDGWFCDIEAFVPGALVGVTIASLIDGFTLTEQRRYRAPERVWTPVVSASPSGGQVGLAGTF